MPGRVGDLIGLDDRSVGVDQVTDPLRIVGELVAGFTQGLEGGPGAAVLVRKQGEGQLVLVPEGGVVGRGVEGDTEDAAVGVGECLGLITQALSFNRSTGGVGLGVPPQQCPLGADVG